ncbi:MAG: hypothetical protein HXN36_00250 [Prevotella histicola]|uniref:Uncharacterized protein n=2 Tax=Prevotella histicola TaxID=470565 RepID=A0A930N786_9BACT|nr:hypothetical protein [Prevotella histicola]MBF1401906.1 hypothetical protein [Prevotella histicola]MBF1415399.1 hypothetical protein [Prevotella histicola]MBF1416244.1 hypothetical protein [Prevotella histicola]MBS5897242.1 hypothetical protein [Prevotella histicola]
MRIMRKSINILLSILLSILIVWIGSGIMTMVCEHTGNVSLAQQMEKKNCKNSDAKHCMKMQIKTLSPTNTAQTVTHQFHPVQLSLLPQLTTSCDLLPLLVQTKAPEKMLSLLWHSPPRQYLRILTMLLI